MNIAAIRNQYTEYQRRAVTIYGMRREFVPPIVRHINTVDSRSFISYANVNDDILTDTIEREKLYFEMIGHDFEWKVYDYDQPADLRERLATAGFVIGDEEAVMVIDVHNLPDSINKPHGHDVRRIHDPQQAVEILQQVQNRVFDDMDDDNRTSKSVMRQMMAAGENMPFIAAYVDGNPASAAWMTISADNPFAGLWGGATLKQYRGRGLYTALIATRADIARERGIPYLQVDASPMSRPILEKLGFGRIATTWEANYILNRK